MSIKSVSHSPQAVVLSPLLQPDHLSLNSLNSNRRQHKHRKLSMSPQLRSSSGSFSSESAKSPKSPKTNRFITHLSLDLTKPQDINPISLYATHNNVEDSPQLLATSVGAEVGSELVPSISNISLLSLNQQYNNLANQMLTENNYSNDTVLSGNTSMNTTLNTSINTTTNATISDTSTRFNQTNRHINYQRVPNSIPMQHAQFTIGSSRKSSFHSPTLQSSQIFMPQSRSSMRRSSSNSFQPQQQSQYRSQQPSKISQQIQTQTQTNPIQIKQKQFNIDETFNEPDSPSLAPISLAGSPSNFLLSHNSPPNSYKSASYLSNNNISQQNNSINPPTNRIYPSRPPSSQLKLSLNKFQDESLLKLQQPQHPTLSLGINVPLSRADSLCDSIGGRSPDLIPVSTTLPPMTPLVLSMPMPAELSSRSDSNAILDDDDEDDDYDDNEDKDKKIDDSSVMQNDDIFGETIDD